MKLKVAKVANTNLDLRGMSANNSNPKKEEKEVERLSSDMTFQQLLDRAEKIQSQCEDYVTGKAKYIHTPTAHSHMLQFNTHEDTPLKNFRMSRFAFSQLCSKVGVPVRYMEKCSDADKLHLVDDNMNSWIESYGSDLLIRTYGNKVRGVLSPKYSTFDAPDILNAVGSAVNMDSYTVKGYFMNEERLHLRMVSTQMLPVPNEDLFAGMFLDSSDVGRSTLRLNFGLWKQVCTNGLIVPVSNGVMFQQKHIGISPDEFQKSLSDSVKRVDELTDWLIKMVTMAVQTPYFKSPLVTDDDMKELVSKMSGLSEDGSGKVIDLMKNKYGKTKWGYINSVTEVAQDFSLERRLELESHAGKLLVA